MTDHLARTRRIRTKLTEARERGLECFGSKTHGFVLGAPIAPVDLERFERERSVELPACYRSFLLEVGHGGAGPYYGLYTLDKWDDFATWVIDDVPADFLSRACPLAPGRAADPDTDQDGRLARYGGTLSLGTQGCAFMMQLIVTGEHRGRVVYVDADGQAPFVVREPDFLSWYERWLDELLGGYETSWFGFGPGGDEERLVSIALPDQGAAADEKERAEAVHAMARLPRLSELGAGRVAKLCRDTSAAVRAAAFRVTERFALRQALDAMDAGLDDSDARVRNAALRAALVIEPARFTPQVLDIACRDPDSSVAFAALFALDKASLLTRGDRIRIMTETAHGGNRSHAAYKMPWEPRDAELLVRLLGADDAQTRSIAAGGLKRIGARAAVPALIAQLERETEWFVVSGLMTTLGAMGDARAVPVLLSWTDRGDDFHRVDALSAIAAIGDDRAAPIARAMLAEDRPPVRNGDGTHQTSIHTIAKLTRDALARSPNPRLRELAHG